MNRYIVTLTEDERETLRELTSKDKHNSQKILNALILLRTYPKSPDALNVIHAHAK